MDHKTLTQIIVNKLHGMEVEAIKAEAETSGTELNKIRRALKIYHNALETGKRFGLIGVGCITFADHRLTTFCRRAKLG